MTEEMLTWTCHACGDTRPDEFISVFQRRSVLEGGVEVFENVRYCNDRPECGTLARDLHWIPPEQKQAEE